MNSKTQATQWTLKYCELSNPQNLARVIQISGSPSNSREWSRSRNWWLRSHRLQLIWMRASSFRSSKLRKVKLRHSNKCRWGSSKTILFKAMGSSLICKSRSIPNFWPTLRWLWAPLISTRRDTSQTSTRMAKATPHKGKTTVRALSLPSITQTRRANLIKICHRCWIRICTLIPSINRASTNR